MRPCKIFKQKTAYNFKVYFQAGCGEENGNSEVRMIEVGLPMQ